VKLSLSEIDAEDIIHQTPVAIAIVLTCVAFLFGASTWPTGDAIHESIEIVGIALIAVHAVGRAWCWRYAHPKEAGALVTTGPYSVCRNPQDLFLIIGGVGIGAQLGSFTSAFTGGLVVWVLATLRIIEEERRLRGRFNDTYQAYRRQVPKFIPNPTLWIAPNPARFIRASLAIGILRAWPLGLAIVAAEAVGRLHDLDIVPVLFRLP
jgi:protein-S-isoprenylcysteine O-methyltransferase Ste14